MENDLFGCNFDIDDGAELKFGKHKEHVVCHVTIFRKVVNYRPVGAGLRKDIEQQHFSYSY